MSETNNRWYNYLIGDRIFSTRDNLIFRDLTKTEVNTFIRNYEDDCESYLPFYISQDEFDSSHSFHLFDFWF